jgi:hypothetical protein
MYFEPLPISPLLHHFYQVRIKYKSCAQFFNDVAIFISGNCIVLFLVSVHAAILKMRETYMFSPQIRYRFEQKAKEREE